MQKYLLEESEISCIVKSTPIPTFIIDKNHKVIYWNKALEELTNVKEAEILNKSYHSKVFYDEDRPVLADLLIDGNNIESIKAYYGNVTISESKIANNSYIGTDYFKKIGNKWIIFSAAPIKNKEGIVIAAIETLQDITIQKKYHDRLKTQMFRYKKIIDNIAEYIFSFLPNGKILSWNFNMSVLTGIHEKDILEKEFCSLPTVVQFIIKQVIEKKGIVDIETQNKDGTKITLSGSICMTKSDNSIEFIFSGRDITNDIIFTQRIKEGFSYIYENNDIQTLYNTTFAHYSKIYLFTRKNYSVNNNVKVIKLNEIKTIKKKISKIITEKKSIIIFENISYLIMQNGFENTCRLLFGINDLIHGTRISVLVKICPKTLSEKEYCVLLEEFESLPEKSSPMIYDEKNKTLLNIINNANQKGQNININKLSNYSGLSRVTVRNRITRLLNEGYIYNKRIGNSKFIFIRNLSLDLP